MGNVQHPLLPTKLIHCLVGAEETQDRQGPYCMPLAGTCTAVLAQNLVELCVHICVPGTTGPPLPQ